MNSVCRNHLFHNSRKANKLFIVRPERHKDHQGDLIIICPLTGGVHVDCFVLQGRTPQTIPHRWQPDDLWVCREGREEICDGLQQLHWQNLWYPVQGRKYFKYFKFVENILQEVTGLSSISLSGSAKKKISPVARVYKGSNCEWIDLNKVLSDGIGCANGHKFVIKPQTGSERLCLQGWMFKVLFR